MAHPSSSCSLCHQFNPLTASKPICEPCARLTHPFESDSSQKADQAFRHSKQAFTLSPPLHAPAPRAELPSLWGNLVAYGTNLNRVKAKAILEKAPEGAELFGISTDYALYNENHFVSRPSTKASYKPPRYHIGPSLHPERYPLFAYSYYTLDVNRNLIEYPLFVDGVHTWIGTITPEGRICSTASISHQAKLPTEVLPNTKYSVGQRVAEFYSFEAHLQKFRRFPYNPEDPKLQSENTFPESLVAPLEVDTPLVPILDNRIRPPKPAPAAPVVPAIPITAPPPPTAAAVVSAAAPIITQTPTPSAPTAPPPEPEPQHLKLTLFNDEALLSTQSADSFAAEYLNRNQVAPFQAIQLQSQVNSRCRLFYYRDGVNDDLLYCTSCIQTNSGRYTYTNAAYNEDQIMSPTDYNTVNDLLLHPTPADDATRKRVQRKIEWDAPLPHFSANWTPVRPLSFCTEFESDLSDEKAKQKVTLQKAYIGNGDRADNPMEKSFVFYYYGPESDGKHKLYKDHLVIEFNERGYGKQVRLENQHGKPTAWISIPHGCKKKFEMKALKETLAGEFAVFLLDVLKTAREEEPESIGVKIIPPKSDTSALYPFPPNRPWKGDPLSASTSQNRGILQTDERPLNATEAAARLKQMPQKKFIITSGEVKADRRCYTVYYLNKTSELCRDSIEVIFVGGVAKQAAIVKNGKATSTLDLPFSHMLNGDLRMHEGLERQAECLTGAFGMLLTQSRTEGPERPHLQNSVLADARSSFVMFEGPLNGDQIEVSFKARTINRNALFQFNYRYKEKLDSFYLIYDGTTIQVAQLVNDNVTPISGLTIQTTGLDIPDVTESHWAIGAKLGDPEIANRILSAILKHFAI